MQHRLAVLGGDVHVRALAQQKTHDGAMARLRCRVERRFAIVVARVDGRPGADQLHHLLEAARRHRFEQRRVLRPSGGNEQGEQKNNEFAHRSTFYRFAQRERGFMCIAFCRLSDRQLAHG